MLLQVSAEGCPFDVFDNQAGNVCISFESDGVRKRRMREFLSDREFSAEPLIHRRVTDDTGQRNLECHKLSSGGTGFVDLAEATLP